MVPNYTFGHTLLPSTPQWRRIHHPWPTCKPRFDHIKRWKCIHPCQPSRVSGPPQVGRLTALATYRHTVKSSQPFHKIFPVGGVAKTPQFGWWHSSKRNDFRSRLPGTRIMTTCGPGVPQFHLQYNYTRCGSHFPHLSASCVITKQGNFSDVRDMSLTGDRLT